MRLTTGFSPQDVPAAAHGQYDLAFIDGLHTDEQLIYDFEAVLPYLLPSCVVVLHDVGYWDLKEGVEVLKDRYSSAGFKYVRYAGRRYRNVVGTGLFARGIHAQILDDLAIQ